MEHELADLFMMVASTRSVGSIPFFIYFRMGEVQKDRKLSSLISLATSGV